MKSFPFRQRISRCFYNAHRIPPSSRAFTHILTESIKYFSSWCIYLIALFSRDLRVPEMEIRSHMCRCCWKPGSDEKPSPKQEEQNSLPHLSLFMEFIKSSSLLYKEPKYTNGEAVNTRHQNDRCQIQAKNFLKAANMAHTACFESHIKAGSAINSGQRASQVIMGWSLPSCNYICKSNRASLCQIVILISMLPQLLVNK